MADTATVTPPAATPAAAPTTTPTPAAAPTTTPAPAAAPTTTPAPAATPAAPRNERGQFAKPQTASTKPTISAKKVFGEDPNKSAQSIIKAAREKIEAQTKTTTPNIPDPDPIQDDEPAAPAAVTPAEPAPPVPPAEPKIKFRGKEYTQAELDAHFAELEAKANQPVAAAPAPAPAPEPPKQLTPEQVAAQKAEIQQKEAKFVQDMSAQLDAPLTEQEVDTLLAGGKEAVQVLTNIRKRDMALAVLEARKGIATALNPIIEKVFGTLNPLVNQYEQIQRHNVETQFTTKHKDFVPHLDRARAVAEELYKRYPDQVNKMSPEQFIDEVARQTDMILTSEYKRWNPSATTSWRDAARAGQAPPAVQPSTPAAQPAAAPAVVAPPAAPKPPAVKPPAANAPAGFPAPGGSSFQAQVARSIRG